MYDCYFPVTWVNKNIVSILVLSHRERERTSVREKKPRWQFMSFKQWRLSHFRSVSFSVYSSIETLLNELLTLMHLFCITTHRRSWSTFIASHKFNYTHMHTYYILICSFLSLHVYILPVHLCFIQTVQLLPFAFEILQTSLNWIAFECDKSKHTQKYHWFLSTMFRCITRCCHLVVSHNSCVCMSYAIPAVIQLRYMCFKCPKCQNKSTLDVVEPCA